MERKDNLFDENLLESLLKESQPELALAEAIRAYLESNSIEKLEDESLISFERVMKFLSLGGNPTLGEMKSLSKAMKKRLRITFD